MPRERTWSKNEENMETGIQIPTDQQGQGHISYDQNLSPPS